MLALDAMSYSYEEVDLDFGGASEDFELAVLENAYRSGSMPRLTGVPPGAPVSVGSLPVATAVANVAHHPVAAGATTAAHGGVQEHPHLVDGDDLTHSALFAEGLEDFSSFPVNFAHLPVDGEHRRDEFDEDVKGDNGESLLGVKRDYKVMEDGDFDEDEPSISKNSKTVKDSNKSHTRRCREKVNDKFKQLLEELPLPPTGIEVQHKAQILDYTIKTLKDLSNQKTSLETELAFSSKKNLLRWVDHVISNSRTLSDAVRPFLDMFCTKKGWKYAELWLPSTQKGDGTGDPNHEMLLRLKKWVLNRSLGSSERDRLTEFGCQSQNFTFNPRVGVPGRVFSTLRPEWLPKLDNDETFVRSTLAATFGLNVCLAVFFDTDSRDYDADCLDLAIDIASLIGDSYSSK